MAFCITLSRPLSVLEDYDDEKDEILATGAHRAHGGVPAHLRAHVLCR